MKVDGIFRLPSKNIIKATREITDMSEFLQKTRSGRNLVFAKYVDDKAKNVLRRMSLHVDNFDSFADDLRSLIRGVDIEAFQYKSIEEIYDRIVRQDQRVETLKFLVYVKATRLESPAADLFVDIIKSNKPVLQGLSNYLAKDSWPRSFYGRNMLTHTSRTGKNFTHAVMSPLTTMDRKNILPSNKVSSPLTSLFLLLKEFAYETRDSHLLGSM